MIYSNTIWIDLENSPHVLFFNPIIKELKNRDCKIIVTARDYAQVVSLANLLEIDYKLIGHHYGKNKIMKVLGLLVRSMQLIPIIRREKPVLALSHGSRAQLVIAKIFGIKTVMAFDYEYTQKLSFLQPDLAIVPALLHEKDVLGTAKWISRYPGIKEDVYIHNFIPDPTILQSLGIDDSEILVTIRPPATQAHYHSHKSDILFEKIIEYLSSQDYTRIIVTPRTRDQEVSIKKVWSKFLKSRKIIIPDHVVSGVNLIWHSDIVISAGGTMIREAAALGIPAYSIFSGKIGAVDQYLSEKGVLTLIRDEADIVKKLRVSKREIATHIFKADNETLHSIVDSVINMLNNIGISKS